MRHLQKSGIITLKALGGPIGSRTAQVQEAYEVHYSDGIRAAKKFSNEKQAIQFAKDLIKSKKGLQYVDVFNAGSGFHSTADTDAIVAWWGKGSYTDNKSKHDSKLASKKMNESINEGKKAFKVNPGIGSSKYSISSHDGVKKHKDGSDFYDIQIFKNKVDLEKGIKDYKSKGFVEESINEAFSDNKNLNYIMKGKKIKNVVYDDNIGFAIILDNGKYIRFDTHSAKPGMVKDLKMESVNEENPGLWANIRAKQARGEAPAPKNSQAYKDAVEAGKKINKEDIENVANGLPQTMGKEKSLKREALKSIVREVMQEEAEYQKFFQKVMDKAGKSIPSMSDEEKKAFFNKVDAAWKGKQEGK
jgi:hypothetical protein